MDLDWCLICEQKTRGTLYCSDDCKFKDYLSAYSYLTPPASPTSSGSSTPTGGGNVSIGTNSSFVYPFYRKPTPSHQRPSMINGTDHLKDNTVICVLPPSAAIKKSDPTIDDTKNLHV